MSLFLLLALLVVVGHSELQKLTEKNLELFFDAQFVPEKLNETRTTSLVVAVGFKNGNDLVTLAHVLLHTDIIVTLFLSGSPSIFQKGAIFHDHTVPPSHWSCSAKFPSTFLMAPSDRLSGTILFKKGYGMQHIHTKIIPTTVDTIFNLGAGTIRFTLHPGHPPPSFRPIPPPFPSSTSYPN
jgi:hypothetical protein